VNCGPTSQTVELADDSPLVSEIGKNQDEVELFSAADLASFFTLTESGRCPLSEYVILDSDGNEINSTHPLYDRLGLGDREPDGALFIDTTTDPTNGTVEFISYDFKVKAVA